MVETAASRVGEPYDEASKAELVYATVRRRIRHLELKPGAPIRKDELALEFGVSRSPVSEAVARLADDGLVEIFPQHGSFVAPIRLRDVEEGAFVRIGLETEAVRRFAGTATADQIGAVEANVSAQAIVLNRGEMQEFYELDERFHALLFAPLGFSRTWRFVESSRAQLDRVRLMLLPIAGRSEATLAEHRRILEALKLRDPDFAVSAMRAHLAGVTRVLQTHLAQPTERLQPDGS